jgi:CheY-like chemotaxis protein
MAAASILRVDDEDTCASISDLFVDLGYTVDVAYDGPAALEPGRMNQYRLALLDYKMPGMDGLELCRRLRASQPEVVVALVTAFASAATTEASGASTRSRWTSRCSSGSSRTSSAGRAGDRRRRLSAAAEWGVEEGRVVSGTPLRPASPRS